MLYAIYPGTVTTYEDEVITLTYEELIALYGVDEEDCALGSTVKQGEAMYYIHLKPRRDNIYPNMTELVELGDEIKWGPDFDGKKRWTQETDWDKMYADREAEEQP